MVLPGSGASWEPLAWTGLGEKLDLGLCSEAKTSPVGRTLWTHWWARQLWTGHLQTSLLKVATGEGARAGRMGPNAPAWGAVPENSGETEQVDNSLL